MNFQTSVTGKWILAGEHSVLRGSPAIVFPLFSRTLDFSFESPQKGEEKELTLELDGEHGKEMQLIFWGVIEKACHLKNIHRNDLSGKIKLKSSIPIGAGLGASAALCSAVARWFQSMNLAQHSELLEFSRNLENLFHGESSGVDVAVALSAKPLVYVRNGLSRIFIPSWQPKWFLSYSGHRGVTLDCVTKVKKILEDDFQNGALVDSDMQVAVGMCEAALSLPEEIGYPRLVEAIELAESCFERWGLVENSSQQMNWLRSKGAVAVKPTGSGDGGYILSLWKEEPSAEVLKKLIPCF